jgi:hypothetical protein
MKRALIATLVMGLLTLGAVASSQSGLAVGDKIAAFLVKNCEGGDPYCQVCKYGKRPKLISVGDLSDPGWVQDLKAIQALNDKYSKDGKGLAVFGLAVEIKDGKASPVSDPAAALAKLKQIKEENKITFPLVIAENADAIYKAKGEKNPGYEVFENYYKVTQSRTVMFGDSQNNVKYSTVLTDGSQQIKELESVVEKNL